MDERRNRAGGGLGLLPLMAAMVSLAGALSAPHAGAAAQQQVVPPEAGPPVRQSWVSDRRTLGVGHIITILIDEQTLASADKEESSVRDRSRDLSLSVGSSGSLSGGSLRTNNDVADRERGGSSRRERFVAEVSARVVAVGPGDILQIEGVKKLQIDEHEQEVTVRGYVRSADVTIRNTIESWRIAEAEILYDSNDELGKAGGFWSKLLDLIIP